MTKLNEIIELLKLTVFQVSPYSSDVLIRNSDEFQDMHLVDFGVNSIDYAEIVNMMMVYLNVDLTLETFSRMNKVRDVVEILHSHQILNTKGGG